MPLEDYYYPVEHGTSIDEDSELVKLAKSVVLPPLIWAGQTLAKPNRAILGTLAGQPNALLNLIPFSDTLGITDPNDAVSGRDLLRHYGLADKEDNWGNFLAGLAVDIATDPISYLTLGANSTLTAGGKIAAKAGILDKMPWAERIAAGHSGLIGVRSPFFYDAIAERAGLPTYSKPFLTADMDAVRYQQHLKDMAGLGDRVGMGAATLQPLNIERANSHASRYSRWLAENAPTGAGRVAEELPSIANPRSWGEYLAGQAFTDARGLVDKIPYVGPTLGKTGDYVSSLMKSAFVPGSGTQVDTRSTPILARTVKAAEEASKEATYGSRLAATESANDGMKYLASKGIVGDQAEQVLSRQLTASIHNIGEYYQPLKVIDNPEVESTLAKILAPAVQHARDVVETQRNLGVKAGAKIGEDSSSPWLDYYFPRQAQIAGVAKKSQQKGTSLPQSVLPGGPIQYDDLINTNPVAGIATKAIPIGMTAEQHAASIEQAVASAADQHANTVIAARDARWGKAPEPSVADMAVSTPPTLAPLVEQARSVKAKRVGSSIDQIAGAAPSGPTVESFMAGLDQAKNLATPEFAKTLHDLAPQLDKDVFDKAAIQLQRDMKGIGKDKVREITDAIGAAGADPTMGIKASDNIIMKIYEARKNPVPVAEVKPQSLREQLDAAFAESDARMAAEDANPAIQRAATPTPTTELPYPSTLTDEAIRKDSKTLMNALANTSQDVVQAKRGFFRNDVVGALQNYTNNISEQVGKGTGVLHVLSENAVGFDAIRENPRGFVSLKDAIKKIGDTGIDVAEEGKVYEQGAKNTLVDLLNAKGKTTLATDVEGKVGMSAANKALDELYVPADLVPKLKVEFQGPGFTKQSGIMDMIRGTTSSLKTWLTQPWMAKHVRDFWEGAMQQGLAKGLDREAMADTAAYMAGAIKDPAKLAEMEGYVNRAYNTGTIGKHQVQQNMGEASVGKQKMLTTPFVPQNAAETARYQKALEDKAVTGYGRGTQTAPAAEAGKYDTASFIESVKGHFEGYKPSVMANRGEKYATLDASKNVFVQQGMRAAEAQDTFQRLSHYISLEKQGYAPQAAAKAVTTAHIDYGALTPFERNLKEVIPFYSWSKGNLIRTAKQFQDPGAINALLRVGTQAGSEGYVPDYVSQGLAIPIPGGEDGKQRYISGLSTPFDDELFGAAAALAQGSPLEAARRAMSSVNPLIKFGVTAATGRQLYSGRRLDEFNPTGITSVLPNYAGNVMAEALSATPLGRLATTVNSTIAGKDKNILLKLMSGIRTTDVDTQLATQQAAKQAVSTLLRRTGQTNVGETIYAKPEFRDENQPEQLQALLELMKAIQARGTDLRSQRVQP